MHARQERGLEDSVPNDPIEELLREVIIGEIEAQSIVVVDYDPAWCEGDSNDLSQDLPT